MFGTPSVTVIMSSTATPANMHQRGTYWLTTCVVTAFILGSFAVIIAALVNQEASRKLGVLATNFGSLMNEPPRSQLATTTVTVMPVPPTAPSPAPATVIPKFTQQASIGNPIIESPFSVDNIDTVLNTFVNGKMLEDIKATRPLGPESGDAYVLTFNRKTGRPEFYRTWRQETKNLDLYK